MSEPALAAAAAREARESGPRERKPEAGASGGCGQLARRVALLRLGLIACALAFQCRDRCGQLARRVALLRLGLIACALACYFRSLHYTYGVGRRFIP